MSAANWRVDPLALPLVGLKADELERPGAHRSGQGWRRELWQCRSLRAAPMAKPRAHEREVRAPGGGSNGADPGIDDLNPCADLTVRLRQAGNWGGLTAARRKRTQAAGGGLNVAQVLADLGHRLTAAYFSAKTTSRWFTATTQRRGSMRSVRVRANQETRSKITAFGCGGKRFEGP